MSSSALVTSTFSHSNYSAITLSHTANSASTTVPIRTTYTSSSKVCIATLQGQVLSDGSTALIYDSNQGFVTLDSFCTQTYGAMSSIAMSTSSVTFVPSASASTSASASQDTVSKNHQSSLSPGIIAGLVLAVVALLLALCGGAFWLWYRRRSRMAVVDMPAKDFSEDASDEIRYRWETDGAEIKEMEAGPPPVEIGDARSIGNGNGNGLTRDLSVVVSPMTVHVDQSTTAELEDVVSPISPKEQRRF